MESRPLSVLEELLSQDSGQVILRELKVSDYIRLKRTNHNLYGLFNQKLPLLVSLPKLAYSLAQAPHDDKVRFLLKNNLDLLNIVFEEVKLKSRTVTNVTPLQLVCGAGDDVMCGTLAPFFAEKYGSQEAGLDEMEKQMSELKNVHNAFDFKPIIQAISNESFNNGYKNAQNRLILSPATLAAIEQFRKDFDESQPKVIDKGMHFRWETLEELFVAYSEAAVQWDFNYYNCALFEDAVVSVVLGYLPENGVQSCNQGLYYLQQNNPEPSKRMEKTRDKKNFFAALKQPSPDFNLVGSCVDIVNGQALSANDWRVGSPKRGCMVVGVPTMAIRVKNFCERKISNLQSLCSKTNSSNRPGL